MKRRELIRRFRELGWLGPEAGTRHSFMYKGEHKAWIPNPHEGDISVGLLSKILKEAGISREDWESVA